MIRYKKRPLLYVHQRLLTHRGCYFGFKRLAHKAPPRHARSLDAVDHKWLNPTVKVQPGAIVRQYVRLNQLYIIHQYISMFIFCAISHEAHDEPVLLFLGHQGYSGDIGRRFPLKNRILNTIVKTPSRLRAFHHHGLNLRHPGHPYIVSELYLAGWRSFRCCRYIRPLWCAIQIFSKHDS